MPGSAGAGGLSRQSAQEVLSSEQGKRTPFLLALPGNRAFSSISQLPLLCASVGDLQPGVTQARLSFLPD